MEQINVYAYTIFCLIYMPTFEQMYELRCSVYRWNNVFFSWKITQIALYIYIYIYIHTLRNVFFMLKWSILVLKLDHL